MLGDSAIAAELRAISGFYNAVQPDFDGFMERYGLVCPSGCGECCAHFIPDVTPSEALLIALEVLFGAKKNLLQERLKADSLPKLVCPFYDAWNPHHCMIYSSRPLVCRLFYSCATADKEGNRRFCRCHFNAVPGSVPDDNLLGGDVRIMDDYGEMLEVLQGNSASTELLPAAVSRAIDRIGCALNLLFPESDELAGAYFTLPAEV